MDKGNAAADRFGDGEIVFLLAAKLDGSVARLGDAAEYSHQCAFTGAVFPDQPDHLARCDSKVDIGKCLYARIRLADVDQFKDGWWHASSLIRGVYSAVTDITETDMAETNVSDGDRRCMHQRSCGRITLPDVLLA